MYKTAATKIRTVVAFVSTSIITFTVRRITTPKSVFVVHGICYSKEMKTLWKKWQADERVGITFDLYDVGLLFFDKTKIKQQYIINF